MNIWSFASSEDQNRVSRYRVYIHPKHSLFLQGLAETIHCTPSGENATVARGELNRSIL